MLALAHGPHNLKGQWATIQKAATRGCTRRTRRIRRTRRTRRIRPICRRRRVGGSCCSRDGPTQRDRCASRLVVDDAARLDGLAVRAHVSATGEGPQRRHRQRRLARPVAGHHLVAFADAVADAAVDRIIHQAAVAPRAYAAAASAAATALHRPRANGTIGGARCGCMRRRRSVTLHVRAPQKQHAAAGQRVLGARRKRAVPLYSHRSERKVDGGRRRAPHLGGCGGDEGVACLGDRNAEVLGLCVRRKKRARLQQVGEAGRATGRRLPAHGTDSLCSRSGRLGDQPCGEPAGDGAILGGRSELDGDAARPVGPGERRERWLIGLGAFVHDEHSIAGAQGGLELGEFMGSRRVEDVVARPQVEWDLFVDLPPAAAVEHEQRLLLACLRHRRLVGRAGVADMPPLGRRLGHHVWLVVVARVDDSGQRGEGDRRQALRGGDALVHQPAHHVGVAEDGRERPAAERRLRAAARGAQHVCCRAVWHPKRVSKERRAREDAHARRPCELQRRQGVQQRARIAAHRLVVVARDHQHWSGLAPIAKFGEDAVERTRLKHAASVPKVAQANNSCLPLLSLLRHLAEHLHADRQGAALHVQVGEEHPP